MQGAIIFPIESKLNTSNYLLSIELARHFNYTLLLTNTKNDSLKPINDYQKFMSDKITVISRMRRCNKIAKQEYSDIKVDFLLNPYLYLHQALNQENEFKHLLIILDEFKLEERLRLLQRLNRSIKVEILYIPKTIAYRIKDLNLKELHENNSIQLNNFIDSFKQNKINQPCFVRA